MLCVFAALTFLRPQFVRRAANIWFCITIAASSVAIVQTYYALAKPGDWERATPYVESHEHPGEPIVVFEAENALPFAYYYHGLNRVIPIPHGVDFQRYDVTRFV